MNPEGALRFVEIEALEHAAEYVRGLPMAVAITVRRVGSVPDDWANIYRLSPYGGPDLVVRWTALATGKDLSWGKGKRFDRESGLESHRLRQGEHFRQLTCIDSAEILENLEPGRYRVAVTYSATTYAPFEVEVRDPNARERMAIDEGVHLSMEPPPGRWPAWDRVRLNRMKTPGSNDLPLRFFRVREYLELTSTALAEIDPSLLHGMDQGVFAPDVDIFRAEIARAHGDLATFDATIALVRSHYIGMDSQIEEVLQGRGILWRP